MEFTVRALRKKDQARITNMFLSMLDQIDDDSVRDLMSTAVAANEAGEISEEQAAESKARMAKTFIALFKKLATHAADEVNAFMADLIGVSVEAYQDMPFDIDIRILEKLQEAPEINNFFGGASRLCNGTGAFATMFGSFRTKLDSKIKSAKESLTK